MKNLLIRRATPEDALGIATAHVKSFQCAYRGLMPDTLLDKQNVAEKTISWKKILENPGPETHQLVATLNDTIVGWCTAGVNSDQTLTADTGELFGIYIDPEFIGQGVGSALMKLALDLLRKDGFKHATLWVLHSNTQSQAFYEKKGWKRDGTAKPYVRGEFTSEIIRYRCSL